MKKAILLCCGIYCAFVYLAVKIPQLQESTVFLFLLFAFIFAMLRFRGRRLVIVAMLLCAVLGFSRASYLNHSDNFMPEEFADKVVYVEGVVKEVSEGTDYRLYIITPEKMYTKRTTGTMYGEACGDIAVSVFQISKEKAAYRYGDRILMRGTFSMPDMPGNAGEFDYGLWYKTDGVHGSISTTERYTKYIDRADVNPILSAANAVHDYCLKTINTYIGADAGALLSGILLSDRADMHEVLSEDIVRAGLSHICVASGMHLSMFYAFLIWIFVHLRVKRWFYYPLCSLVLHMFALICGGGASITRAVLMFDLCMLSYFTRGDEDRLFTCLNAGFLMLLFNPLYLFSAGFLLSFACVFGILIIGKKVEAWLSRYLKWRRVCSALAVSISAQLFTLPILAVYFNALSPYSLLYNLLVTWLMPFVMVYGIVFLIVSVFWQFGAAMLAFPLKLVLQGICLVIHSVRYLPFSQIAVAAPGFVGVLAYYVLLFGIYSALSKKALYAKVCMQVLCVCLLLTALTSFANSFFLKVHFVNVGEGDCALIETPAGVTVLVDGGGSPAYSERNVGQDIVAPYLHRKGVHEIDYAIVSHYDKDHAQGILYICETMRVKNLILPSRHPKAEAEYKTLLEACAEARNIRVHYMQAGEDMQLGDELFMEAVSPDAEMLNRKLSENNLSLVVRMHYGDMKMLFTGDMELTAEQRVLKSGADIEADLLKVAHHGAAGSSMSKFVQRVSPEYAVISAGKYAVFGHPKAQTLSLLSQLGAETHNTANAGDITFYMLHSGVKWIG